jgi:photosystem II stability/assembly factor-like uncharacterized protein
LLFTNKDPAGFLDALSFWDMKRGIMLGDPVDGHFVILTTADGGETWQRQQTPEALAGEGAFAASGTCLAVRANGEAWFATGGQNGARVFHSQDGGKTWQVTKVGMGGSKSAGIFSLAFSDSKHGIAVGGDYQKPAGGERTVAITNDGGQSWEVVERSTGGYRSGVAFLPDGSAVAVGTSGADISRDGGRTWRTFSSANFNAVAAAGNHVWAVGPKGKVALLELK